MLMGLFRSLTLTKTRLIDGSGAWLNQFALRDKMPVNRCWQ